MAAPVESISVPAGETAEHQSFSQVPIIVPSVAFDICYACGVNGSIDIEFSIEETAFSQWLSEHDASRNRRTTFEEIAAGESPREVKRYGSLTEGKHDPESILVHEGFYWGWSNARRGESACYDRKTNRAYFSQW